MIKKFGRPRRKPRAFLALALLASACGRAPFVYTPNKPLWPGHGPKAPLFAVTAAVQPPHDLTPYNAASSTLFSVTRAPVGSWPELSPEDLGRAMASEFAADGLAASAAVLDDPEHDDAFAARGTGARIFVKSAIENADADKSRPNGGSLNLKLDITVMARQAGDDEFSWTIVDKTYQEQARLGQDGDAAAAVNAALNRLLARAAKDAAAVLQDPALQAKLGWTASSPSAG